MKLIPTLFGRLLTKTQRLFQRARSGSVLILVIALLVLLALMGTAYISTARTERYSSAQHIANTQADLLLQGVVNDVSSTIAAALSGAPTGAGATSVTYRPASQEMPNPTPVSTYNYSNYDSLTSDLFLASRFPVTTETETNTSSGGGYIPIAWNSITWPLQADLSGSYTFDSPFENGSTEMAVSTYSAANKQLIQCYPAYKVENGANYPGMIFYVPSSITTLGGVVEGPGFLTPSGFQAAAPTAATWQSYVVMGGDADGDGIADSALWKLPISPIDGVTYYAAVRVIDNNSAIDASTALTVTNDYMASLTIPATAGTTYSYSNNNNMNFGFFRANVGLLEMLYAGTSSSELQNLFAYRAGGLSLNYTSAAPPTPVADADAWKSSPYTRGDFSYFSYGDLFDQQIARRPANPGYISINPTQCRSFSLSDAAAVANRFCLRSASVSESTLESYLPAELYTYANVTTSAYSPDRFCPPGGPSSTTGYWFDDLFNIGITNGEPTPIPMRPLMVTRNGVSNGIPTRYGNTSGGYKTWSQSTTYAFGDIVEGDTYSASTNTVTGTDGYLYVSLQNVNLAATGKVSDPQNPSLITSAGPPAQVGIGQPYVAGSASYPSTPAIYENVYWARLPFSSLAVKASVNTATFDQLWLAFCHVMTDASTVAVTGTQAAPIRAATWNPPIGATGGTNIPPDGELQLPMFRSSIRDNRAAVGQGTKLTPMQMMQLRAALAAVNTLDLRDADNDVTSRHVVLSDPNAGVNYDAEVFGNEIQPYISEVFANVDPTTPKNNYIMIELVNPYPVPITITPYWAFATLGRPTTAGTAPPSLSFVTTATLTGGSLTIPAATGNKPQLAFIKGGNTAPAGFNEPPSTLGPTATVNNLENVLTDASGNAELYILKPRLFNGTSFSSSSDLKDQFAEALGGAPNPYEMVPVDEVDFSGADAVAIGAAKPIWLHYRRGDSPTGTPSYAYNFVYPGPYYPDPGTGSGGPKYALREAFEVDTAQADSGGFGYLKLGAPAVQLGPSVTPAPTYYTAPIQLQALNAAGVNAPSSTNNATKTINSGPNPLNQFPFGGFARNADLLQVPFIGAYRLRVLNSGVNTPVVEMNSITADAAYAFDNSAIMAPGQLNPCTVALEPIPQGATRNLPTTLTTTTSAAQFVEQIGRFCPVGDSGADGTSASAAWMDFNNSASTAVPIPATYWHYHWAKKLFDYLTVEAPHDDYFPNVDPTPLNNGTNGTAISPTILAKYPDAAVGSTMEPQATANRSASIVNSTANGSEDTVGVEGLININTAPWPVLAQLPFVPRGSDFLTYNAPITAGTISNGSPTLAANNVDDNVDLAKAIVAYRNVNGPFQTIYDLYKVPAFAIECQALWDGATGVLPPEPTPLQGYFVAARPSPSAPNGPTSWSATTGSDTPRLDFAERFLLLDHVSNLITTRSDSFTCYVLLQGWRNVGSGAPTLAVQRRAAFILDRTGVTLTNSTPSSFPIPTQ